jgi:chromosome segregation ATPase
VDLEQTADRLYALPPEDFTAARTAAAAEARKAGDRVLAKEVAALKRPTVGAWLVNTLTRAEPELLEQLLALGPALADAQNSGQGDALRELGDQRRRLVSAVTAKAFEAAGRADWAAARQEVESTLEAALADGATAEAVRSGRLTRSLSYAGFGGVELDGAVAGRTPTQRPSSRAARPKEDADDTEGRAAAAARAERIAAAEAAAHQAAGALDDAVRVCERATREHEAADREAQEAAQEVSEAERRLREARERRDLADEEGRRTGRRTDKAVRAVEQAQHAAEKARAALDRLRRD